MYSIRITKLIKKKTILKSNKYKFKNELKLLTLTKVKNKVYFSQ